MSITSFTLYETREEVIMVPKHSVKEDRAAVESQQGAGAPGPGVESWAALPSPPPRKLRGWRRRAVDLGGDRTVSRASLRSQAGKAMPGEEGHNPARGPGRLDGTGCRALLPPDI